MEPSLEKHGVLGGPHARIPILDDVTNGSTAAHVTAYSHGAQFPHTPPGEGAFALYQIATPSPELGHQSNYYESLLPNQWDHNQEHDRGTHPPTPPRRESDITPLLDWYNQQSQQSQPGYTQLSTADQHHLPRYQVNSTASPLLNGNYAVQDGPAPIPPTNTGLGQWRTRLASIYASRQSSATLRSHSSKESPLLSVQSPPVQQWPTNNLTSTKGPKSMKPPGTSVVSPSPGQIGKALPDNNTRQKQERYKKKGAARRQVREAARMAQRAQRAERAEHAGLPQPRAGLKRKSLPNVQTTMPPPPVYRQSFHTPGFTFTQTSPPSIPAYPQPVYAPAPVLTQMPTLLVRSHPVHVPAHVFNHNTFQCEPLSPSLFASPYTPQNTGLPPTWTSNQQPPIQQPDTSNTPISPSFFQTPPFYPSSPFIKSFDHKPTKAATPSETIPNLRAPTPPPADPDTLPQAIASTYDNYNWSVYHYTVSTQCYSSAYAFLTDLVAHNMPKPYTWSAHVTSGFIKDGAARSFVVLHNAAAPFTSSSRSPSGSTTSSTSSTSIATYTHPSSAHESIHWTTYSPSLHTLLAKAVSGGYVTLHTSYSASEPRASEKRFHRAYWLAAKQRPLRGLLNHNHILCVEQGLEVGDEWVEERDGVLDEEEWVVGEEDMQDGWVGEVSDGMEAMRVWEEVREEVEDWELMGEGEREHVEVGWGEVWI